MSHVTVERDEAAIAVVTIDRPPANAMDLTLMAELIETFENLAADPPAAVVLSGTADVFSAGVDLKLAPSWSPDEQRAGVEGINGMALAVYGMSCPVVGAITGHAIAGGMVLALCTDLRIASGAGRYGLTEVRVGVPYPAAAIGVVEKELSPHAARRLALGGELVSAQACAELGVFDEVVADGVASKARALELAADLAAMPGDTYERTKAGLRAATVARLTEAAAADPLLER